MFYRSADQSVALSFGSVSFSFFESGKWPHDMARPLKQDTMTMWENPDRSGTPSQVTL